jgi:hypothetical protein
MAPTDPKDTQPDPFDTDLPGAEFRRGSETVVDDSAAPPRPEAPTFDGFGDLGGAFQAEFDSSRSCLVMGPGKVGKTTLIAAIDQACNAARPRGNRPELEFVGSKESGDLMAKAVQQIVQGEYAIVGSTEPKTYKFSVGVRARNGGRPEEPMRFEIKDGAGGALFPKREDLSMFGESKLLDWERDLLAAGRKADAVVLCLNPNDDDDCALTHRYVSTLLGQMVSSYDIFEDAPKSWRQRLFGTAPSEGMPIRIRKLRASRFLLLFNKVDLYAHTFLSERETLMRGTLAAQTPEELATLIDPVMQACELLGEVVLRRIDAALPPNARFAVGFCSNWGFDPQTGDPFMPDGLNPRGLHGMKRQRRPGDWTPFGVLDAVDFIVTGTAAGSVRLVDREKLARSRRERGHEIEFNPESVPV